MALDVFQFCMQYTDLPAVLDLTLDLTSGLVDFGKSSVATRVHIFA